MERLREAEEDAIDPSYHIDDQTPKALEKNIRVSRAVKEKREAELLLGLPVTRKCGELGKRKLQLSRANQVPFVFKGEGIFYLFFNPNYSAVPLSKF